MCFNFFKKNDVFRIEILRNKRSYDYKAYPDKPSGFDNNWKNNSIDVFRLFKNDDCIFKSTCQSVANYNWGDYKSNGATEFGDTIIGNFEVKLFVEPRNFHGEIHGIMNAKDVDGQTVNEQSMQIVNGCQTGRWLIHDRYSFNTNKDTNYAWSAGCIILASKDLEDFNSTLKNNGFSEGDIIQGKIVEG